MPLDPTVDTTEVLPYAVRRSNTDWLDVNSNMRSNGKPELLPDAHAINNSLNNLFGCPVGSRGKIFEPTYGTYLYDLLHEPLDDRSAFKIRASLIQSIEKWEPRIRIVHSGTYVQPSYSLTGYQIRVQYLYLVSSNVHATSFFVSKV